MNFTPGSAKLLLTAETAEFAEFINLFFLSVLRVLGGKYVSPRRAPPVIRTETGAVVFWATNGC